MFTQMHACFALQRQLENRGHLFPDESHEARLLTVREVLEIATMGGAIVLGMDSSNVDSVFVAGKAVKRNGQLVGVNVERLLTRAEAARDAVRARVGA